MNGSASFITVSREITIIQQVGKPFSEIIDIAQLRLTRKEMIISLLWNPEKAAGIQAHPSSGNRVVIRERSTAWSQESDGVYTR